MIVFPFEESHVATHICLLNVGTSSTNMEVSVCFAKNISDLGSGKPWENHRKTMGKWWFHGVSWDLPSGVIKHGNGKSPMNGGFIRKITDK